MTEVRRVKRTAEEKHQWHSAWNRQWNNRRCDVIERNRWRSGALRSPPASNLHHARANKRQHTIGSPHNACDVRDEQRLAKQVPSRPSGVRSAVGLDPSDDFRGERFFGCVAHTANHRPRHTASLAFRRERMRLHIHDGRARPRGDCGFLCRGCDDLINGYQRNPGWI